MARHAKQLVDTIIVKQDVGTYEPVFKKVILECWNDGTVTWKPREDTDPSIFTTDRYIGDT